MIEADSVTPYVDAREERDEEVLLEGRAKELVETRYLCGLDRLDRGPTRAQHPEYGST